MQSSTDDKPTLVRSVKAGSAVSLAVGPFWGFLINNWFPILMVIALLGAGGVYMFQKNLINYYKDLYTTTYASNIILADNNLKLKSSIADQNLKILIAERESKKAKEELDKLGEVVDNSKEEIKKLQERLKNLPTPQNCEESLDYLKDRKGEIKWGS